MKLATRIVPIEVFNSSTVKMIRFLQMGMKCNRTLIGQKPESIDATKRICFLKPVSKIPKLSATSIVAVSTWCF
jgi:hypothetical protein